MIAEDGRDNAGTDDHPRGLGAEGAKPTQRERRVPAMVLPRLKMIAHENRIEANRFRETRGIQKLAWAELLCRRFVAKLEHRMSPLCDRSSERYCPRRAPSMALHLCALQARPPISPRLQRGRSEALAIAEGRDFCNPRSFLFPEVT